MDVAVEQLTESLGLNGLLSALDIESACSELSAAGKAITPEQLLGFLTERGRLTEYQRLRVGEGRSKDLVLGNYTIVSRIGAGGMGEVFKAVHRRMKRQVAIKVLLIDKVHGQNPIDMFQREIETMSQLSHPNIVAAYDADECDRGVYLVMEYVGGSDLSTLVNQHGVQSLRKSVDFITQAARGLHYAHARGVVHGDIKPANMLLSQDGTVKITDLGLARLMKSRGSLGQAGAPSDTQSAIAGTVGFMPPEQAFQPETVDHRADIYSLGCTLYYLLTGQPLFQEKRMVALLVAHRDQPRPKLRDLRPDAPFELEAIYQRMVAPQPADRFGSMNQVVEALEACVLPNVHDPEVKLVTGDASCDSSMLVADERTTCLWTRSLVLEGVSVLLVEQSRLQTRMISSLMTELGVETIYTAASGEAAWEAMLKERPDVVVSSMHLPDMTGADLVRRMRSHNSASHISFVLISSETDYEYLEPIRQSGTAAILPKPFDISALRQALMAAVDFSPHAVKAHNLRLTGLRILIVDDSRSARSHVRRVLENLGGEIFTEAVNGSQAIGFLEREQFDVVVTDRNMPECDGVELTQHIRRDPRHQHVPVLMITSETDQALLDDAIRAGVSASCPKVFDPQLVMGILTSLLDAGRPRGI